MSHAAELRRLGEPDVQPVLTMSGHTEHIRTMAYLPDGERIATGSGDKTIRIWRVEDGSQVGRSIMHAARVWCLAVTSDGRRIVSGDEDGRITVWDLASQRLVIQWSQTEAYPAVAISPDNQMVAYGDKTVDIRELDSGRVKHRFKVDAHDGVGVFSLCFLPGGRTLASGTTDGVVRIHDIASGRCIHELKGHKDSIWSLQCSPDGSRLYSASRDATIRCWNTGTGEQVGKPWTGHTTSVYSLSLSRDGKMLASGSWDRTVRFWDTTSGNAIGQPLELGSIVCAVNFSPSDDFVAVAGLDSNVSLCRVPQWKESKNQSLVQPTGPPTLTVTFEGQDKSDSKTLPPSPPDLTRYIVKVDEGHREGGSFGDVYRCRYDGPSGVTEVVVKAFRFIFTLEEEGGAKYVKMLRRELGIWKRLDHGNIVPFLGIARGFGMLGTTSLVSVWMPNGSLHKFITDRDDELTIVHRLQLLSDVANGLDYLHSFPGFLIVHGDLNTNNVLLDQYFTARLADFGYSSFLGGIPEGSAYLQRSTARPGALRWIAPEQIEDTYERTPKSDIYSFGSICLEVLSGKQPWSEVLEEVGVVLHLAQGQHPGRPDSRPIDDHHWRFIQRCWSPIEERPSSENVVAAVQRFLSSHARSRSLHEVFGSSLNLNTDVLPPLPASPGLSVDGVIDSHSQRSRESVDSSRTTDSPAYHRKSIFKLASPLKWRRSR